MTQGYSADGIDRGADGTGFDQRARFSAASTLSVINRIFDTLGALAQDESALLRSELRASAKSVGVAAGAFGVCLLSAGAMLNFLGLAAVGGLVAVDLPLWGAALIVAGALAVIMIAAVLTGLRALRSADPVPHKTIGNVRRDFSMMREALRRGGQ